MNYNKLLERQLKQTIVELKYDDLMTLLKNFYSFADVHCQSVYKKKGIKCTECQLLLENFDYMGYGRNEEEATGNAIKGLFYVIVSKNFKVEEVKQSLKLVHKGVQKKTQHDYSINLTYNDYGGDNLSNISMIPTRYGFCTCSAADTVIYQNKKIANLEARLKLLNQENTILKDLLLKYLPGANKYNRNTGNLNR